ncbi:MAG: PLAT/LH2 domain-containing protein [Saprospiraceae bacterium]
MKKITLLLLCICANYYLISQPVHTLFVEIKTGDKRFAGTDDPVHLLIGGKDFNLDNPNHDDLERNHTDLFTLAVSDPEFSIELIRAVGVIRIEKTGDSYFGGGWLFGTIKIWINDQSSTPIYTNDNINQWLDGDHRGWGTILGDPGWQLPESPPFPPCTVPDDVIILLKSTASEKPNGSKKEKIDSDCDGIPDDSDPTFDPNQPDNDGDGLPNTYEEQNGLDPNSIDTDKDGWLDNKNIKDLLLLTKIECLDEDGTVEIGSDEVYLDAEDVRFPLSSTLDNYWEMDDDTKVEPFIVIDSRVSASTISSPAYKTRIKLRESDFTILEKPFDDTWLSTTLDWGRNETKMIDHNEDGRHYKLHFKSITTTFMDPSPTDISGDFDNDGLFDSTEFFISAQDPRLRLATENGVEGYDGLASPIKRELFIEIDATSSDDKMPFDAKQQVASQFYYHNISPRFDDGYLHGGEILPYDEEVEFSELQGYKNLHEWPQRINHFKYALYVPSMGSFFGEHGRASRPGSKFMVSRTTMLGSFSAIVFIHELGHTLSLCHTQGSKEPPFPSPSCPTPADWFGDCTNPVDNPDFVCCRHYCGVNDNDVTAMGADIGVKELVIGGLTGIFIGLAIIALFIPGIGWVAGALLLTAAALIGAFSGFFFTDAYERVVDYHLNEWNVIKLFFR